MSGGTVLRLPVPARPRRAWVQGLVLVLAVVGLGVLLGRQYVSPDKRVLAVLVALLAFGVAWRMDMISGIGLLVLALPFPRGTVFGNTNLALILLLLVIWLLRSSQGRSHAGRRTPLDVPILGLVFAYVISFYNVANVRYLFRAWENFELFIACLLMFYLIVSNVRTEWDLKRVHVFQAITAALVCLLGIYELNHPGEVFIPGWIHFTGTHGTEFDTRNVRIGSSFYDFELLSEFCAINLLLAIFLYIRANSLLGKIWYLGLILLVTVVLFATCTRGSIVALGVGLLYFLWLVRKQLKVVPFTIAISALVAGFLGMNYYISHFTRSGDLLARFSETRFVGWAPDTRIGTWQEAWTRMMEHPIIGHGPYYALERGIRTYYWPHNVYLYIGNLVGIVGLAFFLWLLWKLWKLSRPTVADLRHDDYAQGFLLVAHVQLLVFMVDQLKIDYLRNSTYQFQPWVMFAVIVAAFQVARGSQSPSPAVARERPPRLASPGAA